MENNTNYEITKSSHGNDAVVHDDYFYIYDKSTADGTAKLFKCRQFKSGCRRRLRFENNSVMVYGDSHNHEPDLAHIINRKVKLKMKRKINLNPTQPSKRVYDEVIIEERRILKDQLNQSQLSLSLPKFDDIRSSLHQIKRLHFP